MKKTIHDLGWKELHKMDAVVLKFEAIGCILKATHPEGKVVETNWRADHKDLLLEILGKEIPNLDCFFEFGVDESEQYVTVKSLTGWFRFC